MRDFTTKALHTRPLKRDVHGSLRFLVYDSVAFELDTAEEMESVFKGQKPAHLYSRITNPTVEFFEQEIKSVSGAAGVIAVSSGMAAISNTILALCGTGDNIITSRYLFGNTYSLFCNTLKPWGLKIKFTDFSNVENLNDLIDNRTRLIFLETVTNPQLQIVDLRKIAKIADENGILLIADSTLAPFGFGEMKNLGVHIELLSSTKYLSGGATAIGGLIIDYGSYDWSNHDRYAADSKDTVIIHF